MRQSVLYDENLKVVLFINSKDEEEKDDEPTKKKRNRESKYVTSAVDRSKCRNKRKNGMKSAATKFKLKTDDDVYMEFYKGDKIEKYCTSKEIMQDKIQKQSTLTRQGTGLLTPPIPIETSKNSSTSTSSTSNTSPTSTSSTTEFPTYTEMLRYNSRLFLHI